MARSFVAASSQYLENANAVVSTAPLTLSCWFQSDDVTINQALVVITDIATTTHYFSMILVGTTAGDPLRAQVSDGSGSASASTSTGYTAGTWHHGCAVFASTTSRAAYIDGGSKGTNPTSKTPAGLDRTGIGRRGHATPDLYMSGRIAEVVIRNAALSDEEVAAEAKGLSPLLIQPQSIVGYWPLWGLHSPEIDLTVNNRQMTVTGAALANHAPVVPFSSRNWGNTPLIEAAGGVTRQMMHYARMRAA